MDAKKLTKLLLWIILIINCFINHPPLNYYKANYRKSLVFSRRLFNILTNVGKRLQYKKVTVILNIQKISLNPNPVNPQQISAKTQMQQSGKIIKHHADRIMVKRLEVKEMSKIFLLYVFSINMVEGYIWHKKFSSNFLESSSQDQRFEGN